MAASFKTEPAAFTFGNGDPGGHHTISAAPTASNRKLVVVQSSRDDDVDAVTYGGFSVGGQAADQIVATATGGTSTTMVGGWISIWNETSIAAMSGVAISGYTADFLLSFGAVTHYWTQDEDQADCVVTSTGVTNNPNTPSAIDVTVTTSGNTADDLVVGWCAMSDDPGTFNSADTLTLLTPDWTEGDDGAAMNSGICAGNTTDTSHLLSATPTAAGIDMFGACIVHKAAATGPAITSVDDTTLFNGQTGVTITGTDFGASQGSGSVIICPTDDVDDVSAETQTITSWGDTSIDFTAVRGALDHTDTLYLFVIDDDDASNSAGESLSFVDETPTYSVTPNVESQTTTTYTIGATADFDCTLYAVAVNKDETAPSIAEVKLGQKSGGGAAPASANAMFSKDSADTLALIRLGVPISDIYVVAVSALDGDGSLVTLADEILDPATGKQHVTVAVKEITAASKADPCRITVTGHGFTTGQQCRIWGVGGMTELNDGGDKSATPDDGLLYYDVTRIDDDTLDLDDIDSTGYTTYTSGGYITPGFSTFEDASPPVADSDLAVVDTQTDPDDYAVTFNADGTFEYDSSGDEARQSIVVNVFDLSEQSYTGETTFYINNQAPAWSGEPLPIQSWAVDESITSINLGDWISDLESDAITYVVSTLPSGLSQSVATILGTPTTETSGSFGILATDAVGDSVSYSVNYAVLDEDDVVIEVVTTWPTGGYYTARTENSRFKSSSERTKRKVSTEYNRIKI